MEERKEEFLELVKSGNKEEVNKFLLENAAAMEKKGKKSNWVGEPIPIDSNRTTSKKTEAEKKKKIENLCVNYEEQIKELKNTITKNHLVVWKVEQDLGEEGIDDLVMDAREQVGRIYDEGIISNKLLDENDEKERKENARTAIALLTEKLYFQRDLTIKQKAYIFLTIINGKQQFRVGDVAYDFKGRDFDEEALTAWIYKWTNHHPFPRDNHCSFRIWEKNPMCEEIVRSKYGYC